MKHIINIPKALRSCISYLLMKHRILSLIIRYKNETLSSYFIISFINETFYLAS